MNGVWGAPGVAQFDPMYGRFVIHTLQVHSAPVPLVQLHSKSFSGNLSSTDAFKFPNQEPPAQVEAEAAQRGVELAKLRASMESELVRVRGEAVAAQRELRDLRGEVDGLLQVGVGFTLQ